MTDPHDPMQFRPSGEIPSLATLDSPDAIRQLTAVGERFGKVRGVLLLPKLTDSNQNYATFLVNFETGADATRAAQTLNCPLYGYTTVIVAVPQMPAAPEPPIRQSRFAG
jgi:hypothetical protein